MSSSNVSLDSPRSTGNEEYRRIAGVSRDSPTLSSSSASSDEPGIPCRNDLSFTNGNNLGIDGPIFEKQEIIGKGAYGSVYRGLNRGTGELVALKVIDLDHPDNEDISEIQKEVALLSQLRDAQNHNITLYHGCWISGHELWIAMDLASGGSIRTLMKAGPIEERLSVIIVREVLIALAYLHKEGIIHRDIKAANILLTQDGKIMLCDFGVAAHLTTHSKRSTFIGTPYWMAPEVITEGKLYDTKADIWSLGITVYEIANGLPPLANFEALRAVAMIPRNPPPKLEGAQWSEPMKEFMSVCLTVDPTQRPTATELSKNNKWIRGASKVPTTLLRELIVRYSGWVNAGGVRTSIIGDVARRDDTFDFDTTGSWIFDGEDVEHIEALGDEPYFGTQRREAQRPVPNHPLMRMFETDESSSGTPSYDSGYGSITIPSADASQWGSGAETIRPNSITIPDFDNSEGVSAFAPAATPWFMASATSVGSIPREAELVESGETDDEPSINLGGLDLSSSTIGIPSDPASPTTIRPNFASGANLPSKFSNIFNPNPFNPNPFPSRRNRQASNDSAVTFGSGSGSGSSGFGPPSWANPSLSSLTTLQSSPPSSISISDGPRSASPDTDGTARVGVSTSPSLPTMPVHGDRRRDDPDASPRRGPLSPLSIANRLRSNTAPNFDSNGPPTPTAPPGSKGVLQFSSNKPSPFQAARAAMQQRPSALNIPSANGLLTAGPDTPGGLTPRHFDQESEDALLTPMPAVSPAQTPTSGGFPFNTSISTTSHTPSKLSHQTSASDISTSGWPEGPKIRPFDYTALTQPSNVHAELERIVGELGQWLSTIDAGMTHILAEAA